LQYFIQCFDSGDIQSVKYLAPSGVRKEGHGGLAPNSCMIGHIIVSGEAILSTGNTGKPLGGRGSTLPVELTALLRTRSWWDGIAPLPKNPIPTLGLQLFGLLLPISKACSLARPRTRVSDS